MLYAQSLEAAELSALAAMRIVGDFVRNVVKPRLMAKLNKPAPTLVNAGATDHAASMPYVVSSVSAQASGDATFPKFVYPV